MDAAKLPPTLIKEIEQFVVNRKSLMLSTQDNHGRPHTSYAPFAIHQQHLFIFISQLAQHTQQLIDHPNASILLIEDESNCEDIFARVRLNYQVTSQVVARDTELWEAAIEAMTNKLGERMSLLRQLGDFVLFQLVPTKGRYIKGFGKAYELESEGLAPQSITHLRS